jgi:hypothetical protein
MAGRDPDLVTKVEKRLEALIATGFQIRKVDRVARNPKSLLSG